MFTSLFFIARRRLIESGTYHYRISMVRLLLTVACGGFLLGTVSGLRAQNQVTDLTGIWWGGAPIPVLPEDPSKKDEPLVIGGGIGVTTFPMVLTAHGEAVMADFDPLEDPAVRCEHPGLVRAILNPYPMKIEQVEGNLNISYEEWTAQRLVRMNSEFPDDRASSNLGYSIGHYDNGKLVISSMGMTRGLNMTRQFLWVSEQASTIEEYSLNQRGQLILEFTLTDPTMLAEPWRVEKILNPYGQGLLDFECETRERPSAD